MMETYQSIIQCESAKFIKNIHDKLHIEVSKEFAVKCNFEDPYLSDAEKQALATNNGKAEPKKFGDCPDNIFISPTSPITFSGHILGKEYNEFFQIVEREEYPHGNGRVYVRRGRYETTGDVLLELMYDKNLNNRVLFCIGVQIPNMPVRSNEIFSACANVYKCVTYENNYAEYKIDYIKEHFYCENREIKNGCIMLVKVCYPKIANTQITRYFVEFMQKFDPQIIFVPVLIHYDFYIQERMGFLNRIDLDKQKAHLAKRERQLDIDTKAFNDYKKKKEEALLQLELRNKKTKERLDEREEKLVAKQEELLEMETFMLTKIANRNKDTKSKLEIERKLNNIKATLLDICIEMIDVCENEECLNKLRNIQNNLIVDVVSDDDDPFKDSLYDEFK